MDPPRSSVPSLVKPFPYRPYSKPKLQFVEKFGRYFPSQRKAITINVISDFHGTTSHVMHVSLDDNLGGVQEAVLKLYDRRYPGSIRQKAVDKIKALSVAAELGYQTFVGQGEMHVFSMVLRQIYKTTPDEDKDKLHAINFYSNQVGSVLPGNEERFEAAVWYENDKRFKTELKAYKQLESIQGDRIPRLYAHVRIPLSFISGAGNLDAESEEFLCVNGLLLQYIPGLKFKDWATPEVGEEALTALAQHAVDTIHHINNLGIFLKKLSNNVIVVGGNNNSVGGEEKSFIVDLTGAEFKKDLVKNEIKKTERSDLMAMEHFKDRTDLAY